MLSFHRKHAALACSLLLLIATPALANQDYAIFDGQRYNGRYYPRIDIIEWGTPAHLEFHIYSKDDPVEIEVKPIERGGKRVLLVNYFISSRQEKVCRSVVAPAHFRADSPLYLYLDASDSEYRNIYVSANPLPTTRNKQAYPQREFSLSGCEDLSADAANSKTQENAGRGVASGGSGEKAPAAMVSKDEGASLRQPAGKSDAPAKKHELIDYENNALPFNF